MPVIVADPPDFADWVNYGITLGADFVMALTFLVTIKLLRRHEHEATTGVIGFGEPYELGGGVMNDRGDIGQHQGVVAVATFDGKLLDKVQWSQTGDLVTVTPIDQTDPRFIADAGSPWQAVVIPNADAVGDYTVIANGPVTAGFVTTQGSGTIAASVPEATTGTVSFGDPFELAQFKKQKK